MIHLLTDANQAPLVTLGDIRQDVRRVLVARAGAIANYVALIVLLATMAVVPNPILFASTAISFMFAIPLPMMERRGLTLLKGPWAGFDAMALSILLSTLFAHTLWEFYALRTSGIDFTVRLSSFMALPALFDLMARLARREAVSIAQAVIGGAVSIAFLSQIRLPWIGRS